MDFDLFDSSETVRFGDLYTAKKALGKGSFGRVVRCTKKTSETECAVKIISKTDVDTDLQAVASEVQILASFDHENIVKFQGVHQNRHHIFIEMELLSGGTLSNLLKRKSLSDEDAATIMKGILNAVSYMHDREVLHRDLKPDNIMFLDDNPSSVKVTDFGLSAKFGQHSFSKAFNDTCGTASFMAPEQVMHRSYSKPADIWSCAIMMYMAITGRHPLLHIGDDVPTYTRRLQTPKWDFPASFCPMARQLFLHMTNILPLERYTAEQALRHPWISREGGEIPRTYLERLTEYNAKARLKRLVSASVALGAMLYRLRGKAAVTQMPGITLSLLKIPKFTEQESSPSLPSPVKSPLSGPLHPVKLPPSFRIKKVEDIRRRSTGCCGISLDRIKEVRETHMTKQSRSPLPSIKDRSALRPTYSSYLRKSKLGVPASPGLLK